ncbi:plasmid pRiA4b ORF-3 family protein [Christiangramia crocea]|uniref:Plasmid pRiA4b ORF-3 family protein n=1 Tax=Christiangramia crocea TaxID=2904124 RepID=A0A9X2A669_9FLAO|nr:plasmid pRiA4b ORF-3 family protein [Gramella crocea]MCG9970726.1 plasmid pRiA4b ORF-3 family protein [Gramella crocea]
MCLEITLIQGGMREFERTGIYPEYLLFNLPGTRQSWKVRIKQKPQKGVLKSKGKVLYEYNFSDSWCKYRKAADGLFTDWREPESMIIEMRD